jgi:hypothetical protein
MDQPFQPGDRVYHEDLGVYGKWVEAVADGVSGEMTCSRVEVEDGNGRTLMCPSSSLSKAE